MKNQELFYNSKIHTICRVKYYFNSIYWQNFELKRKNLEFPLETLGTQSLDTYS
jgi:hypothetical protein